MTGIFLLKGKKRRAAFDYL